MNETKKYYLKKLIIGLILLGLAILIGEFGDLTNQFIGFLYLIGLAFTMVYFICVPLSYLLGIVEIEQ